MNVKIEIDCTPAEARTFLGLPDVTALNAALTAEMQARMQENLARMQPEELLRGWTALGAQATEHFASLMAAAAGAPDKR